MTQGFLLGIMNQTFYQILLLSIPLLGVAMIIGLLVSIFQATTSIQEQTLTFVPKMVAILLLLIVLGPFYSDQMIDFVNRLFDLIATAHM